MSSSTAGTSPQELRSLAQAHGVQLAYHDLEGREIVASDEALGAIVAAMGAPAGDALVDPVHVVWDGEATRVRLGDVSGGGAVSLELTLEDGAVQEMSVGAGEHAVLPSGLPFGYHDLVVEHAGRRAKSRIISAPRLTRSGGLDGSWGVFVPLYAARSEGDWGIGDLGSARQLLELVDGQGGRLVGSTPLLATFLDEEHYEPSPYAPVSRLFWNESYLDLSRIPEAETSRRARELLRDRDVLQRRADLRASDLVDHRGVYALKREVLEACAADIAGGRGARRDAFESWRTGHELVGDYASFRAKLEDADAAAVHYHQYVQWLMQEQLADLGRATNAGLYLDLPVGVHPKGFDRAYFDSQFVPGMSIGAPPDPLGPLGQDWGLSPLHPQRQRQAGYDYQVAAIRHLFQHAAAVRIDHVMGLHRLFWIPDGLDATQGVYVNSAADEQWAIICLESQRTGCLVVGEDLGTVPPGVRETMAEHGARRTYVMQFEMAPAHDPAINPPPPGSLAAVNTHDTVPWARAWAEWFDDSARASVIDWLRQRGLLAADADDAVAVHNAALRWLAAGDAGSVVLNLEDLWGETEPQNVPGTGSLDNPNWVRRTGRTLEQLAADPEVLTFMAQLTRDRTPSHPTSSPKGGGDIGIDAGEVRHDQPSFTEQDVYLFNEGTHNRMHRVLGSHLREVDGVEGTSFAVWAPNADHVSVLGDFNGWNPGRHTLAPDPGGSGIWHGWIAGIGHGAHYKYHVASPVDGYQVEKADPYARFAELPPKTASIVWQDDYAWGDEEWMQSRGSRNGAGAAVSVYELHPGSWMRSPEDPDSPLGWRDLAPRLIEHMTRTGFTHVELMPIMEHPFYGSWGYQTTGYFAPSSRYGSPEDFKHFVDELHQAGIGVILDWVPSHFPTDQHGLGFFDGTHLYEHADPKQGFHPDWKSWIFNYQRNEVRSFLLSSAMYWLEEFHVDGLRVDAVASMLYLDYSRKEGEWVPNEHGGRENLEAIEFLRRLNADAYGEFPDILMVAEESTAWGGVSRPTYVGGLGFGMKWDMGWMHDTLEYFKREPIHRRHHQGELTFRQIYAYTENFMLPLSHDEVVHGKGSLLARMPGDEWQQFANLRLLLAYMWTLPGKKLLFQGGEFGQGAEWNHDTSLDWHLLERPQHAGIQQLVCDLNHLYREHPAMHELDFEHEGFAWVDASDEEASVLSWLRQPRTPDAPPLLVVLNATPVLRTNYRVGVPRQGRWSEVLNTDATVYWGGGQGNFGGTDTTPVPIHGHEWSVNLTLPPLAAVVLRPDPA